MALTLRPVSGDPFAAPAPAETPRAPRLRAVEGNPFEASAPPPPAPAPRPDPLDERLPGFRTLTRRDEVEMRDRMNTALGRVPATAPAAPPPLVDAELAAPVPPKEITSKPQPVNALPSNQGPKEITPPAAPQAAPDNPYGLWSLLKPFGMVKPLLELPGAVGKEVVDQSGGPKPGALARGFAGGLISDNPRMFGEAIEGLGEIANSPTIRDAGTSLSGRAQELGKPFEPRVPSFTDIPGNGALDTVDRALTYAGEQAGRGVGTSVPSIAAGTLASLVTANPVLGVVVGATGPSYVQNYGDLYGSLKEDAGVKALEAEGRLTRRDLALYAAAGAVPMAALDVIGVERILGPISGAARQALRHSVAGFIVRQAAIGAGTEGLTEGLQEVVSQWTQAYVGQTDFATKERLIAIIDNALGGLLGGGLMGGGAAAVTAQPEPVAQGPWGERSAMPAAPERVEPTLVEPPATDPWEPGAAPTAGGPALGGSQVPTFAPPRTRFDLKADLEDPRAIADIEAERTRKAEERQAELIKRAGFPEIGTEFAFELPGAEPMRGTIEAVQDNGGPEARVRGADGQVYALRPGEFRTIEGDGTRAAPVKAETAGDVDLAAQQVEQPTPAQAKAGNYKQGHLEWQGLDLAIETPKGATRSGIDPDGKPWSVVLPAHYGRVKGTKGADGDQVDIYLGPDPAFETVYVIDQLDAQTGKFDEHKVMAGFQHPEEAEQAYVDAFSDGKGMERIGAVTPMSLPEFKTWLDQGDTKKPLAFKPAPEPVAEPAPQAVIQPAEAPSEAAQVASPTPNGASDALSRNAEAWSAAPYAAKMKLATEVLRAQRAYEDTRLSESGADEQVLRRAADAQVTAIRSAANAAGLAYDNDAPLADALASPSWRELGVIKGPIKKRQRAVELIDAALARADGKSRAPRLVQVQSNPFANPVGKGVGDPEVKPKTSLSPAGRPAVKPDGRMAFGGAADLDNLQDQEARAKSENVTLSDLAKTDEPTDVLYSGVARDVPAKPASMMENVQRGNAAIDRLLSARQGAEHHAMFRDGIGWISFVWGDDRLGLAHALKSRRDKDGMTAAQADEFMRRIPAIVGHGRVGSHYLEGGNVRRNIFSARGTVVLQLVRDQGRMTWVATAHPGNSEMSQYGRRISPQEAEKNIAGAVRQGLRANRNATQSGPSTGGLPSTKTGGGSEPGASLSGSDISAPTGAAKNNIAESTGDAKPKDDDRKAAVPDEQGISRRGLLTGMAGAAAGLLIGPGPALAHASGQPASPALAAAIRSGNTKAALAWVAEHGSDPDIRRMASLLGRKGVDQFKIMALPTDAKRLDDMVRRRQISREEATAARDSLGWVDLRKVDSPTIFLSDRGDAAQNGVSEETLIHEALHAFIMARYRALSTYLPGNRKLVGQEAGQATKAIEEFQSLWQQISDSLERKYPTGSTISSQVAEAMSSPDELLAYGLTSRRVQDELRGLVWVGNGMFRPAAEEQAKADTAWSRFIRAVARMLGFAGSPQITALDRVLELGNALLNAAEADPADFKFARAIDETRRASRVNSTKNQAADDKRNSIPDEQRAAPDQTEKLAELAAEEIVTGTDKTLIGDAGIIKRWIVHPRTIAAYDKHFVPVYRAAVRQFETRDQHAAEITRQAKPYFDLPPEDRAQVDKLLELGRLEGTVYARDTLLSGVKNDPATNEGRSKDAALTKPGDTIKLTERQADGYKAVRAAMDRALDLFKAQLIEDFGFDPATIKSSADILATIDADDSGDAKRVREAAQIVREVEQAQRTGYVPFSRWGQVAIAVRRADERQTELSLGGQQAERPYKTIHFEMIEVDGAVSRLLRGYRKLRGRRNALQLGNLPEVKSRLADLKKRYGNDPDVRFQVFQVGEGGPLEQQVRLSDLDMLAEVGRIDNEAWTQVREQLERAVKMRGFRKHFFGAKNTPGYSTDFERGIADYTIGIAGYLARRKYGPIWDGAIGKIPTTKPKLRDYAQKYRTYTQEPQEELQALRQAGFIYYLAGSVATAMVNTTQVPLVTVPWLSMFSNSGRVLMEVSRAYNDARAMLTTSHGMDIFDPAKAPADVREAFQTAWDEGFFVPLNTWEMMGTAQNRSQVVRRLSKAGRTTVDAIALMFTAAERLNRIVTWLAAYRLGKQDVVRARAKEVLADNALARSDELMRGWTPEKFAGFAIDETQLRMGKVNRPSIMRHAGAAVLQFKGFVMQVIELQARMLTQYTGMRPKVAFATMLLLLILTAGVWGVPFAQDLRDLIEWLHRKLRGTDLDLDTELREMIVEFTGSPGLAEAISRGVPRKIGIDLQRIGMGNILPGDAQEVGGIPLDLTAGRVGQAIEHEKRGDWLLMIGEMLPTFLKNPLNAWSWAQNGIRSQTSGRVVIPPENVTVGDVALKASGFTPSKVANLREAEYAKNRAATATKEVKDRFIGELARLRADILRANTKNDATEAQRLETRFARVLDDIREFNEDRPLHERVIVNPRTLKDRIAEELKGAEVKDGKAPRQARPRRQEIETIYGTEK